MKGAGGMDLKGWYALVASVIASVVTLIIGLQAQPDAPTQEFADVNREAIIKLCVDIEQLGDTARTLIRIIPRYPGMTPAESERYREQSLDELRDDGCKKVL